jgi:release factor glutamine methyltransferase
LVPFDHPEFHRRIDLVTCNPPYISTAKVELMHREIVDFEPEFAFDGGAIGVKIEQQLIRQAPKYLWKGGWLIFEVGSGQGPGVIQGMKRNGSYSLPRGIEVEAGEVWLKYNRYGGVYGLVDFQPDHDTAQLKIYRNGGT